MERDRAKGAGRLASVIDGRVAERQDTSLILDFASVQNDYSIWPNTFQKAIPLRDCMVCKNAGRHSHDGEAASPQLMPGDRVLVGWVQCELVVIDIITKAANVVGG